VARLPRQARRPAPIKDYIMPLLDHFHPPLYPTHHWDSFHSNWATRLADALTPLMPPEFLVEEHTHGGARLEIDIATYKEELGPATPPRNGPPAATLTLPTWAPPAAAYVLPAVFPDTFEIRVFSTTSGLTLVAAIELVSPGNKDRPDERRAFATKCASYLHQGVSLIVMDTVTTRQANLHNETMRLMAMDPRYDLPDEGKLYAVAYRPVRREDRPEIDVWPTTFAVGDALPTLPLRLTGDTFVPVDFEAAYQEACRRRRLA
jgi:hypothetical protein